MESNPLEHFLNQIYCDYNDKLCQISECLESTNCQENRSNYFDFDKSNEVHMLALAEYLENHKPKDANDALLLSENLVRYFVESARTIPQNNIITFHDVKDLVKDRIYNLKKFEGVKASKQMSWFNKYLKGFRRGEFTLLTGHTGSGKTTFLNQYSLEFANCGVPTLFCSFELKNEVVLANMLKQFSGENLDLSPDNFEFWAERFARLPMYFQKFFGTTTMEKVLETIKYTINLYDVAHVVLDNLQFMIGIQGKGFEKFDIQDEMISRLRALATDENIHITLVIHPRKSVETEDLSVASIFGTAKAIQESDNILIIQNREKFKVIDIKKNRFDGEIGRVPLIFNKENKRFQSITLFELENLLSGKTVQELLKEKEQKGTQEEPGSKEKDSQFDPSESEAIQSAMSNWEVNQRIKETASSQGFSENSRFRSNALLQNNMNSIIDAELQFTNKRNIRDFKIGVKNNGSDRSGSDWNFVQNRSNDRESYRDWNQGSRVEDRGAGSSRGESNWSPRPVQQTGHSFDMVAEMKKEESETQKSKFGKFWVDENNLPNFYESGRSNLNYEDVRKQIQDKSPQSKSKTPTHRLSYEEQLELYLMNEK